MPQTVDVELSFEKGQFLSVGEYERLPPGYGRYLSGWGPTMRGLIPRQPWLPAAISGSPSPARGRGLYPGYRTYGLRRPIVTAWTGASRFGTGTSLTIYEIPTSLTGSDHVIDWLGSLSVIETVLCNTEDASHYPVIFAAGKAHVVYTHPGFPGPQLRKWDGSTVTAAGGGEDIGGRTLAYHQNRWFLGGSEEALMAATPEPGVSSRLRFSEEEDPDTWNVTTNYIPVRSRDGDPIEALASWEGFLIIGKRDSVHYLYGSGPTSWGVREITDAVGTASGQNAILATPRGLCFVGNDGYVYRWNGGGKPQRLTQHVLGVSQVYDYALGSFDFVVPSDPASLAYIEPVLYAWVPGTRGILCMDLDQGIEWYEQIDDERGIPYDICAVDNYLLMTPRESDNVDDPIVSFRVPPYTTSEELSTLTGTPKPDVWGSIFRWQSGAISPAPLNGKATAKQLYIRYSQWHDGAGGNGFTVVVKNELGESEVKVFGQHPGALDQRQWKWGRMDLGITGDTFTVEIFQETADDTFRDIYSIEQAFVRFVADMEPR